MTSPQETYHNLNAHAWCLLNSSMGDHFLDFMNPDNLRTGVKLMVFGIAAIVISIYVKLLTKKRLFIYTNSIRKNIEVWISHIIIEETTEGIQLPAKFYRILRNTAARQVAIAELIRCKKNFSGVVAENIVALYNQLGLREDSIRRFNSKQWHLKALGIQELYMMDQADMLKKIYKNTNSSNEFVRMEAQTGVIHLTGFAGLRFLDIISYPITLWHELKLLEQLRLSSQKEDLSRKIPGWLRSENDSVVVFALRLADEYQQFSAREHVINCLVHRSERVRTQAIKTLIRLADDQTPDILARHFHQELFNNQVFILDAMPSMATDEQLDFLVELLYDPDNIIKLKAAAALVNCCTDGWKILEKRVKANPEPFERIYRHIKNVK